MRELCTGVSNAQVVLNVAESNGPERSDLRLQRRFPLSDSVRGHLRAGRHRLEAQVNDLSLGGAGLLLERERWHGQARASLELRVEDRSLGEVEVEVVHAAERPAPRLGVRYRRLDRRFLQRLCAYLVARHSQSARRPRFLADATGFAENADALRIRQLLLHCCRRHRPLSVCVAGEVLGTLAPRSIQARSLSGQLSGRAPEVGAEVTLVHASASGLALFPSRCEHASDGVAGFALPERVREGGQVRLGRLAADDGFPVQLELVHPQLPGRLVRKRVREVSFGGARFDLDLDRDLLAPGTVLDAAVLRLPGGRSLPCRCVVRYVLELEDGGHQCGVELVDFRGGGRELWIEQILARQNPEVEEATPFTLPEAWEVFERSGYLEEKPGGGLEALREPFLDTWQGLLRGRSDARLWLHRCGRPAVGTIATSRIYSRTWLVHHLAVNREVPAARKLMVLADLAPRSAAQWLAGCHPDGHLLIYFNSAASFNEAPYSRFFASRDDGREISTQALHLREYLVGDCARSPEAGEIWIRPARTDELDLAAAVLRLHDGDLAYRALDLKPHALVSRDWTCSSAKRWRELLLAGLGDELLAYAILEGAAPALNVFSLYDTVRVVPARGKAPARELIAAILREASERYRALGRRSFMLLADEDQARAGTPIAEVRLVRAIVAPQALPLWLRHLEKLWGQR